MKNIILDIRSKLENSVYKDEQHIRISLVARICQVLGWDIWNPEEFYTEYPVKKFPEKDINAEESGKVDIALFLSNQPRSTPEVFFETKAPGKLSRAFEAHEIQLQRYNYYDKSAISVLTDGIIWRFYLPAEGGTFDQKMFIQLNFLRDSVDFIVRILKQVLQKKENYRKSAVSASEILLGEQRILDLIEAVKPEARILSSQLGDPVEEVAKKLIQQKHNKAIDLSEIKRLWNRTTVEKPALKIEEKARPSGKEKSSTITPQADEFTFKKVKRVRVFDQWYDVKYWWEVKKYIYEKIIERNPNVQFEGVHRFSKNEGDFRVAMKFGNDLYTEKNLSTEELVKQCRDALKDAGFELNDIDIKVEPDKERSPRK